MFKQVLKGIVVCVCLLVVTHEEIAIVAAGATSSISIVLVEPEGELAEVDKVDKVEDMCLSDDELIDTLAEGGTLEPIEITFLSMNVFATITVVILKKWEVA